MRYLLAILMVLGIAGMAYAAPVGVTSEADFTQGELLADKDMGVSAGFIVDAVEERNIDMDSGEFETQVYAMRLAVDVMKRFNFYVDLGEAADMKYDFRVMGQKVEVEFDDEFIWGVGANALIYRWDNGLEIGAGANYRQADMKIDKATIDGLAYTKSALTSVTEGEFQEYQVALECAWRTDLITPYAGVKLSEVEVDGSFISGGQQYNASGKNASENVGVFVGCAIAPSLDALDKGKALAINVEGRFIDEQAFNVGVSYKF